MYRYLRSNEVKRPVVDEFVDSVTAKNIQTTVDELNLYLEGGSDSDHKQIREALQLSWKTYRKKDKRLSKQNYLLMHGSIKMIRDQAEEKDQRIVKNLLNKTDLIRTC